jgi:outer membrane receptor protein involved in Fe transport
VPFPNSGKTDKFTQELRASGRLGSHFELLVGAFYTHENSSFYQSFFAVNSMTGTPVGSLYQGSSPTAYQEYAGFADVTWKFSDRFDVQLGGRESHLTATALESSASGPLVNGSSTTPERSSSSNVFTYLVTPRYRLSTDSLAYARVASGYRPGGANGSLCTAEAFPCSYAPDKTQDYEIGLKGEWLDRRISLDTSLYYIDWKHLQLDLRQGNFAYTGNGSQAKSEGIELAIEAHPLSGLTVAGWAAWNESILTEALPPGPAYGLEGDRLPYAARFSGNVSLHQDFPLGGDYSGHVGAKVTYVGDRVGEFTSSAMRQVLPAYAQTDVRGGLSWRTWSFGIYANNVADRRGVLFGGLGTAYPFAFQYIQPRTIGLDVSTSF